MKGVILVGFLKGAMMGMVAGAIVGVMNSDSIMKAFNKGTKSMKRMARKYGI